MYGHRCYELDAAQKRGREKESLCSNLYAKLDDESKSPALYKTGEEKRKAYQQLLAHLTGKEEIRRTLQSRRMSRWT